MFWTSIAVLSLITYRIGIFNIVYFALYWLFYKFSGAHNKPTSDSKYDPTWEHQNNIYYKLIRGYESYLLQRDRQLMKSPAQDPLSIPEINADRVNPELFDFLTQGRTRPVVIRGFFADSPAVQKWNPEYFLKEPYCDTVLKTLSRGNCLTETAYTTFTQALECNDVTLGDSIKAMMDGDATIYINNVTRIFAAHPDLVADVDLNRITRRLGMGVNEDTWLKMNVFIGKEGTKSSLHCAAGGNLFFLASGGKSGEGVKEWTLIDPKYTPYLKTTPSTDFAFAVSGRDASCPDEILKKIPHYKCQLRAGDALYNPPWWYHDVANLHDFTFGVAIRDHTAYYQCYKNNAVFTLMSPYWWKLHPVFLWVIEKIVGNKRIREESMKSDEFIVDHLTGYKKNKSA